MFCSAVMVASYPLKKKWFDGIWWDCYSKRNDKLKFESSQPNHIKRNKMCLRGNLRVWLALIRRLVWITIWAVAWNCSWRQLWDWSTVINKALLSGTIERSQKRWCNIMRLFCPQHLNWDAYRIQELFIKKWEIKSRLKPGTILWNSGRMNLRAFCLLWEWPFDHKPSV